MAIGVQKQLALRRRSNSGTLSRELDGWVVMFGERLLVPLLLGVLVGGPVLAQTPPVPTPLPPADLEKQVIEIIRRNPQIIVEAVRNYQAENARSQRRAAWQKYLTQPVTVDIKDAPTQGPADASLTLVEFSDFLCPFCVRAQPATKALLEKYKGQMRLAYFHFPLPNNKESRPAAYAAWAAGQQGKFFEYHDRLFALQGNITPESYERIAGELKLDLPRFNQDRQGPEAKAQIEADEKQARSLGFEGTPTFVLNGVVLRGALPLEEFEEVIRQVQAAKQN